MGYKRVILEEFAGQKCNVKMTRRVDGSKYVSFESDPAYGNPTLELSQLEELLTEMKRM